MQGIILLLTTILFRGKWIILEQSKGILNLCKALIDYGIGAGIVEELVFRGFLLSALEMRYKKTIAIIYSSILFALLHITNTENIVEMSLIAVDTFIIAIFFCLIYYRTQNLWCCIAIHGIWNFIFLGCITAGLAKENTSILAYVVDSEYYLIVPICVISLFCIWLYHSIKSSKDK